jgi:pimeloyl-ACP methyl ester carboxylesterase
MRNPVFFMRGGYSILVLIGVALLMSACGLSEIRKQTAQAENVGVINGRVEVTIDQDGPVVVYRFENKSGVLVLEDQVIATPSGRYQFVAEPGEYLVAAFVDSNNDGVFQREAEPGKFSLNPLTFRLEGGETVDIETIVISGDAPARPDGISVAVDKRPIVENVGKVVSLRDPAFERSNYDLGLWRPIDFIDNVEAGLLFLQEFDPEKSPVLFVHGIAGGPRDFSEIIGSIDRTAYQPWVLYYPSGLRLDLISDYLVNAVAELQSRHGRFEMALVAHSMGGLVTHSFVKKFTERFPESSHLIRLVMTINSPLGGMASAASGVDFSPIVVPAWKDVATESEFLRDLEEWDWPDELPYYLVFSYETGSDDDGVVPIASQIPMKRQLEATRLVGFNNSHVGTLQDSSFIDLLRDVLQEGVDDVGAGSRSN